MNGKCTEGSGENEIFRLPCVSTLCQPEGLIFGKIFRTLSPLEARFVNNPG
jgi:hypothetical protein